MFAPNVQFQKAQRRLPSLMVRTQQIAMEDFPFTQPRGIAGNSRFTQQYH